MRVGDVKSRVTKNSSHKLITQYFCRRMISETGANVHDVCDFSQNGTGSMKTVIHISDPVPPSHPRCSDTLIGHWSHTK